MALRSALRNAVAENGCTQTKTSYHYLYCALRNLLVLPSTSSLPWLHDSEATHPAAFLSAGLSEYSKFRKWFGNDSEVSVLKRRGQRTAFLDSEKQFSPRALIFCTSRSPVTRSRELRSLHFYQVRNISSSNQYFYPRKIERYPARPTVQDSSDDESSEENEFRQRYRIYRKVTFREIPPGRPVVERKSPAEYKQSTIHKSTKNMALVPKKWKRAIPSKEVVDAVIYLKRAKSSPNALKEVLQKRISRLLKLELMLVLSELQRLDEWVLARKVFNTIRKESWYRPDVYLYQTMVQTLGKSKQIEEVEKMFEDLKAEGLTPNDSIMRELLRAYVISGMMPKAIELYKDIQKSGLDWAARTILFNGLNGEQKSELSIYEKKQGYDWS